MTAANPAPVSPVDLAGWTLAWPREVFRTVATALIADYNSAGAADVVEQLVREAFVDGDRIARTFEAGTWGRGLPAAWIDDDLPPWEDAVLHALVGHVDKLPVDRERPYWTERATGTIPKLSAAIVRRQFVAIVEDLYQRGYFEMTMPQGCVDERGSEVDPNDVLIRYLHRDGLWPLQSTDDTLALNVWGEGTMFDLIEVFHDLVARPRSRGRWHNWNNCGWHYTDFDRRTGQVIYRWRVNDLLARSELPYRLADAGEDIGRLVVVTNDARDDLADAMVARTDPGTGDRVRHAVVQYRARAATEHDKRSACITLAGVLGSVASW